MPRMDDHQTFFEESHGSVQTPERPRWPRHRRCRSHRRRVEDFYAAVGYGGMRYLENAVVDAIRTWAAQTPQDAHVELGDISYTLMDNHLVLKNVRMTYVTPAKQTVAATVETLDIRNPGTTLLSLMRDPKSEIKEAELPVADEIALHNLSFGPEPNITVLTCMCTLPETENRRKNSGTMKNWSKP